MDIKLITRNSPCSGCLLKDIIKKDDLHLLFSGFFYLKDQEKVIYMKFCAKEKCVKNITGNLHNLWDMQESMEVHENESIILSVEEKE